MLGVLRSPSSRPCVQTIKYGVTTVDNLCSDLLNWNTLYLAGRMHKPIRIIKDDARVRLTQQVNLTSALRTSLLTLPETFTETELFERIAGFSYAGDIRMVLPGENRGKVGNIVRAQSPQFKELYHRLVVALPGVHWSPHSSTIQQDISPHARAAHLKKLPSNLLNRVTQHYADSNLPPREADETVYWTRMAGDQYLPMTLDRGKGRHILNLAGFSRPLQKSATLSGTHRRCKASRASSARVSVRVFGMLPRRYASGRTGQVLRRRNSYEFAIQGTV